MLMSMNFSVQSMLRNRKPLHTLQLRWYLVAYNETSDRGAQASEFTGNLQRQTVGFLS